MEKYGGFGAVLKTLVVFLVACKTTALGLERPTVRHRNAYATMIYMGTPRDYEFYVATRVLIRSLAQLQVDADLVVIASLDVPPRWVQALFLLVYLELDGPQEIENRFRRASSVVIANFRGLSWLIFDMALLIFGNAGIVTPSTWEQEDGAKVVRVENLNNPYKNRTNFDTRFKLTLNKLYAWSLVEYERVVMLDADNLFLLNTDELFQCGQFCAVFINPCIFHTGLFVLQPSTKVFKDMVHELEIGRENPDGADQGFMCSYFPDLLDQPMFHPPTNGTKLNGTYRLSLGYQMDASYYYLRLRWRVPCGPNSVITFPGAPWLKPWYWWSWPVLPLGVSWHDQRRQTLGYEDEMPVILIQSLIYLGIIAMTRLARPNISKLCYRQVDKSITLIQTGLKLVAIWSIIASYILPFVIIPHTVHPYLGWTLYLLGSFALSSITINAFLLPMLPVLAPWLGIFGSLVFMAFPSYPDGVVRALAVFGYAVCCAPFIWVSLIKVMTSLQVSLEREAFLPKLGESSPPPGFNKLY